LPGALRDIGPSYWSRAKAPVPKLLLNLLYEGLPGRLGGQILFCHSIYPRRACPFVGEHARERRPYPFLLTDKSIEVVETMRWVVQRLCGEATLGFDNIGHTS